MPSAAVQPPTLLTFKQFASRHPAFTEASLRWIRFGCKKNGFASAFFRVAKRVLIDEAVWFRIIAEQNGRGEESFRDGRAS